MKIRIYVEGPSERESLPKVLRHLGLSGHQVDVYPLKGSRFLKEIGWRAAAILAEEADAHVFACPDLAPNDSYRGTRWAYTEYEGLRDVLRREVKREIGQRLPARRADEALARFHAHPFRHDFEVVLLACPDLLKRRLRTETDITKHYSKNPEEQNFQQYPKKVVRRLFRDFGEGRYNPVDDCPAILESATVAHVRRLREDCPRLGELLTALEALSFA